MKYEKIVSPEGVTRTLRWKPRDPAMLALTAIAAAAWTYSVKRLISTRS